MRSLHVSCCLALPVLLVPFQLFAPSHRQLPTARLPNQVGTALAAQAPDRDGPGQAPPAYRGFTPGMAYRDFAARARALARRDTLRCNTPRRTAQLLECGVRIRDPSDTTSFYLMAYVIEGKVAMLSFGDSGGVRLVDRTRRDMVRRLGPARATGIGTWEWKHGRRVARLNWRGRGATRWIYINLFDSDLMDGISRYVTRQPHRQPQDASPNDSHKP